MFSKWHASSLPYFRMLKKFDLEFVAFDFIFINSFAPHTVVELKSSEHPVVQSTCSTCIVYRFRLMCYSFDRQLLTVYQVFKMSEEIELTPKVNCGVWTAIENFIHKENSEKIWDSKYMPPKTSSITRKKEKFRVRCGTNIKLKCSIVHYFEFFFFRKAENCCLRC